MSQQQQLNNFFALIANKAYSVDELSDIWMKSNKDNNHKKVSLEMNEYNNEYDRLTEVKLKVDESKEMMKDNINKIIVRGDNLDVLEYKTTELSEHSQIFNNNAKRIKRKLLCKRIMWFTCAMASFVLFLVIVLSFIIKF